LRLRTVGRNGGRSGEPDKKVEKDFFYYYSQDILRKGV